MAAVAGLRSLGGVILSGLIGAAITAAGATGAAAVGELVDGRVLAALDAANGAFLVLDAGGLLGSGLVDHPLEAVRCGAGLVAAITLMPVIGVIMLPIRGVAVGMSGGRILIGGLELHSTCGHGEGGSRLGGVCRGDTALQHDPLIKDLAGFRCVRRNGHKGVLGDLVGDGGACNGGRALDDRDRVPGGSGILYEPCLAAAGALAGVENAFALTLRCGAAAVPVVAELINDMTVAENLSAAGCTLLVAAIACGGASGLNLIDQLGVAGNFVEGRGRDALGVDLAALLAQAALLAGLLGQQAFLALLAGRVAIDAVDDAGIIVVHALVHRTEAAVAQRAVHRVAVIVCAVIAEAAGVADGYGAAGPLMAFAAQLVILADVALGAGGAVRVLHALRAFKALIAPVGRVA